MSRLNWAASVLAALAILVGGTAERASASIAPNRPGIAADTSLRAIVFELPTASAAARAQVETAMTTNGLAITAAAGDVVTGTYTDGPVVVEIRATVIAVDSVHSRIVITGFGSAPAMYGMPKTQAQVTSTTGGKGKKAWARMQQLAAALAPAAS